MADANLGANPTLPNATERLFILEDLLLASRLPPAAVRGALDKMGAAPSPEDDPRAQLVRSRLVDVLGRLGLGLGDFLAHRQPQDEDEPVPQGLPGGVRAFVDALDGRDGGQGRPQQEGITLVKWSSFEDELDGVARFLQKRLETGQVRPERCCVFVPNRQWLQLACKALERRCMVTVSTANGIRLSSDPRKTAACAPLLAYARLFLLAEPLNPLAWRLWTGIGKQDLGAGAWAEFCETILQNRKLEHECLIEASNSSLLISTSIADGLAFIEAKSELKGFSLMKACGIDAVPEMYRYLEQVGGEEDAASLLGFVRQLVSGPVFVNDPAAVRVCTLDALPAAEFDIVCVLACVDGFVPGPSLHGDAARLMRHASSRAARELLLSYFCKADEKVASQMKMAVARIKPEQGVRMAMLRPSPLFARACEACPGSLSGEAFLARL